MLIRVGQCFFRIWTHQQGRVLRQKLAKKVSHTFGHSKRAKMRQSDSKRGVRIRIPTSEFWRGQNSRRAMVSKLKVLKITQKTENCIHGTYFSASHKFTHPNVGSFVCSIHIGAGSQMIWRSCIVASKRKTQGYKRQCQSENHTHSFTLRVSVFMLK